MQWGDLITLEYGKPIKDKESVDGPIPVYGTIVAVDGGRGVEQHRP